MFKDLILGSHVLCEAFECNLDCVEVVKVAQTDLRDIMI